MMIMMMSMMPVMLPIYDNDGYMMPFMMIMMIMMIMMMDMMPITLPFFFDNQYDYADMIFVKTFTRPAF